MKYPTAYKIMKATSLVAFLELSYFMGDALRLYAKPMNEVRNNYLCERRELTDIAGTMASMVLGTAAFVSLGYYRRRIKGESK